MPKQSTSKAVFTHVTIGLELAITILAFVYGGYKLDQYYQKSPLFVCIGTALGLVLGFYNLIRTLNNESKKDKEDIDRNKKRVKWM